MTKFLGKRISGPYTIPSGIVATNVSMIQTVIDTIPEVGVITTKSIGLDPRPGYPEPVIQEYSQGNFINAVGLTNPGAVQFAKDLATLEIPKDKFMLVSIFGAFWKDFVEVAQILAPFADAFELNLSCPHAEGYGAEIGSDPFLVQDIIFNVIDRAGKPVIAKLSPNIPDFLGVAHAAAEAHASGFCVINTTGPGTITKDGHDILSHGTGGMSGAGVLPIGIKLVKELSEHFPGMPIIGCGGIKDGHDVAAYRKAGAEIIGIGSSLAHIPTDELPAFFRFADEQSRGKWSDAMFDIDSRSPRYEKIELLENNRVAEDIAVLKFDVDMCVEPGKFVYLWVPGVGEKPFSMMDPERGTFAIQDFGKVSNHLVNLEPGSKVYVRGPFGNALRRPSGFVQVIIVAGGTGIAAVYDFAKQENAEVNMFLGGRSKDRVYYVDECREAVKNTYAGGSVDVATDDGSLGYHGNVVSMLSEYLETVPEENLASIMFVNCGPEPMVEAAVELQRQYVLPDQIYSAIDYVTKCGIGLCGSCTTPDGKRSCVDGPFIPLGETSSAF